MTQICRLLVLRFADSCVFIFEDTATVEKLFFRNLLTTIFGFEYVEL